jgi:hypothetical protein
MADNSQCHNFLAQPMSRRAMLQQSSVGFGSLALAGLLQEKMNNGVLAAESGRAATAPKSASFPARAKRIIFMFMHGGPSQVDTFDYKPLLQKHDGRPYPGKKPRIVLREIYSDRLGSFASMVKAVYTCPICFLMSGKWQMTSVLLIRYMAAILDTERRCWNYTRAPIRSFGLR